LYIVDSHAHLSSPEFNDDRHEVIQRSFKEGISAILCPSEISHPQELKTSLDLESLYENIIIAAGLHPHNARNYNTKFLLPFQV